MSILLTADVLARCTGATLGRAAGRVTAYNQALERYGFSTASDSIIARLRVAFLLANVGHECGGFAFQRELWGPTPAQVRYERNPDHAWPPTPEDDENSLAFRLGNEQPGDGFNMRGAGDLQTTGRKNMALVRDRLRKRFPLLQVPDFEADAAKLAEPQWAALASCDYIERVGANQYADAMNFDAYVDLVNKGRVTIAPGDSNGFQQRLKLAMIGLRVLP